MIGVSLERGAGRQVTGSWGVYREIGPSDVVLVSLDLSADEDSSWVWNNRILVAVLQRGWIPKPSYHLSFDEVWWALSPKEVGLVGCWKSDHVLEKIQA